MSRVVTVNLCGGPASGAVVEVPPKRMSEIVLDAFHLSVSPAGLLYNRRLGAYVQGAEVVVNPNDPDQSD